MTIGGGDDDDVAGDDGGDHADADAVDDDDDDGWRQLMGEDVQMKVRSLKNMVFDATYTHRRRVVPS